MNAVIVYVIAPPIIFTTFKKFIEFFSYLLSKFRAEAAANYGYVVRISPENTFYADASSTEAMRSHLDLLPYPTVKNFSVKNYTDC
jgi:hypothetical protein